MAQDPYSYMASLTGANQNQQNTQDPYGMTTSMGMTNPYQSPGISNRMASLDMSRGGGLVDKPSTGTPGVDTGIRNPQQPNGSYNWGQQAQVNNPYANYQGMFDPSQWANDTTATQNQRYLDNTLPWAQYQQNQYQYGNDFNEAQRRWNMEMQRQQGLDTFQQDFSNRQLNFQDWQAQVQNSQWQDQFDWSRQNDLFSQGLANQQFGLQQQQQNWNQNIQQQQQDLAGRQADIEAQYRAGLIDVQTAQNQIQQLNVQNQYNLGLQQNANTLYNYQQQAQNYANQFQLGQGRLNLDQMLGQGNLDLARQKLLQDAQTAAENRAMQEKIAAIQATGRAQAVPQARFVANW